MIDQPLEDQQLNAFREASASAEWVADDARLRELCARWRRQPRVALDTEFQRVDTFYPKPGLIQVASEGRCYLIDPLAIGDFAPFVELLRDPAVLKLLHACSEDLELFGHCYGAVPAPLFDTQLACAFLGCGLSIGYQRLLGTLFGLEVDKQETRSDWLQRPLTEAQKHYAAEDVVYLEAIFERLLPRIEAEGKWEWIMEECRRLSDAQGQDRIDPDYYLRFKQAWKLKPAQLAVLKSLCDWREREARERDMPRTFLLKNNTLVSIALRPPRGLRELSQAEQIRGKTLSRDGQALLQLVEAARALPPERCPPPPPRPLPNPWGKPLKALRALAQQQAERLDIAPELLLRRKDLEALVRSGLDGGAFVLPEGLRGWREAVVGEALLSRLREGDKPN